MRGLSLSFLAILTAASLGSAWMMRNLVNAQERGLLKERAAEIGLVLTSSISGVQAKLNLVGTVAKQENASSQSFTDAASGGNPNVVGVALLRPGTDGFIVERAAGPGFAVGQTITGPRAAAMQRALVVQAMVSTPVMTQGRVKVLGFALGSPAAPAGAVVYQEAVINPGKPSPTTASAPFSELIGSLYASPHPDPTQLILTTAAAGQAPQPSGALQRPFAAGDSHWLLSVTARHPLVGSLVEHAPMFVLVIGVLVSLATFAVIDLAVRRRDYALGLVDARTAELEESLESLKVAQLQAQQSSRLKSQFLANMSHEIRTPMNGVLGMAQLLLTGALEPEQRRRVLNLRGAGQSLLTIIDDILDFSKMEAGRLELEKRDFDLFAIVESAISMLSSTANDKRIQLTLDMDRDVPGRVLGDSGRIRQVLVNLIGNAVKFTERGSVTVRVSRPEGGRLRFTVRDTGIGIDPTASERLLEPFSQGDASTTRIFGGTGLGLAICRQLVDLMGGTLDFTSQPGVGTTFWFEVDLEVPKVASLSEGSDRAGSPAVHGALESVPAFVAGTRLLLVDDNDVNRLVGKGLLESLGYHVDTVRSGAEAIRAARDGGSYAVILMDCLMPEMDGYQATAKIRGLDAPARHTPIIALTAAAMRGDRERCLDAGMDDYLAKPLDLDLLTAALWRCHALPPAAPSGDELAGQGTQGPAPIPVAAAANGDDETALRDRLHLIDSKLPPAAFDQVCHQFLSTTPDLIAGLRFAIRAGDAAATIAMAHQLKGSMASIGALRLSHLAQRLEDGGGVGDEIIHDIDVEYLRASQVVVSMMPQSTVT